MFTYALFNFFALSLETELICVEVSKCSAPSFKVNLTLYHYLGTLDWELCIHQALDCIYHLKAADLVGVDILCFL